MHRVFGFARSLDDNLLLKERQETGYLPINAGVDAEYAANDTVQVGAAQIRQTACHAQHWDGCIKNTKAPEWSASSETELTIMAGVECGHLIDAHHCCLAAGLLAKPGLRREMSAPFRPRDLNHALAARLDCRVIANHRPSLYPR